MPYHDLDTEETWYTVSEASAQLHIVHSQLLAWIKEGRARAERIEGEGDRAYLHESEVERLRLELREKRQDRQERGVERVRAKEDRELVQARELDAMHLERVRLKSMNVKELEAELRRRRLERIDSEASSDTITIGLGAALAVYLAIQLKKRNEENGSQ